MNNSYLARLDEYYSRWETTCSMQYANSIYPLLLLLVSQQPDIKGVEIVDSKNHGKVSLQGEQLAKLKKHMPNSMPWGNSKLVPGHYFTVWYVPLLLLPRSGFVMKRVTLGVGSENLFPSSSTDDRIRGLVNGFGDDIIFGEALTQILTNYYTSGRRFFNLRFSSTAILGFQAT
ncbi:hypothetical protein RHSIM_Rhsim13G0206700 [Rhododendron simsii]|uniref:Uncharacterized protein n=1 Tax=Rhododendron simsii TaxID=118357 RepID=A0A834G251_RHOSS|nr:hypothetical protein RHSIM_Rhsim13G0206700 [Rhododendron simsii]